MFENVIKKLFPIRDENNRPCTFPTFASQVFGEDGDKRALWQADKGFYADDSKELGGKAPGFYTPYTNLADNSDFEHWVAQAGIGGKHGNDTYGGDRWILTSGTITGEENADGDGYSDIELNGTLVQVVPRGNFFDATVFVEMVSGTCTSVYHPDSGEIEITSAGGVIKNVLLLPGAWSTKPEYMAKGYAAELASCCLYFQHMKVNGYAQISMGFWFTDTSFRTNVPLKYPMRKNPSIIIDLAEFQCVKSGSIQTTPSEITSQGINGNVLSLMLTTTTKVSDNAAGMFRGGNDDKHYFRLTADLPRR